MDDREQIIKKVDKLIHDVRSPLASIQSFINIIALDDYDVPRAELENLCEALTEGISRSLEKIEGSSKELRDLL